MRVREAEAQGETDPEPEPWREGQRRAQGEAAAGEAAASETPPPPTMHGALLRNVYADGDGALPAGADAAAHRLAAYVELQLDHLRSLPADDVLAGRISWAPWPA